MRLNIILLAAIAAMGCEGSLVRADRTTDVTVANDAQPGESTIEVGTTADSKFLKEPDGEVTVVSTFSSAGLYLDVPRSGEASVRYRETGGEWRDAVPMDYDPRDRQYRSSIVDLVPGTEYEVVVALGGKTYAQSFSTWPETDQWPIGKETQATGSTTVTESGSPDGYHLVTGTKVKGGNVCVRVEANYVIVRGFQCIGQTGRFAPIRVLNGYHDVVIENNEISEWGDGGEESSWHGNAIVIGPASDTTNERIVVQYNYIHDPGWGPTPGERNSSRGPKGITVRGVTGGNYVFRYNTIVGNDEHYYGDAIGGGKNSDLDGFPGPDTDIYGNYISHCVDDCIESEGGGMNVRIWGNWIGYYGVAIAVAIVTRGPTYIFRNVLGPTRGLGGGSESGPLKVGGDRSCRDCGDDWHGRHYIFHNTFVNVPGADGSNAVQGNHWGGTVRAQTSRNNIIVTKSRALADDYCGTGDQSVDLDYDLWNRTSKNLFNCGRPQEENGIEAAPQWAVFTRKPAPGEEAAYQLRKGTPGHDDGVVIPNFSDGYLEKRPDRGAQETGAQPMCFGHRC